MLDQAKHFSFSRLNTLSSCRMKYYHKYILKSARLEPAKDYFRVGRIVDEALKAVSTGYIDGFHDFCANEKIEFLEEKWEHYCKGIWEGRKELYSSVYGNRVNVDLQKDVNIYILDQVSGEIISDNEGNPMNMLGYLDAYHKESNTIFEVKTTSGGIDQLFIEHKFSGQTQIYAYSIKKNDNLANLPLVIYAYIKKPMIKQKKDETSEQFFQRMYEAGLSAQVDFREVQYTEDEVNETMQFYYDRISSDINSKPVKDRNACFNFGARCEYYGYCWKNQINSEPIKKEDK